MEVVNPFEAGRSTLLDGIVDRGALFSQVPRRIVGSLGLRISGRRSFRLADGSSLERDLAHVLIRYDGSEAATFVVVGEENAPVLWGAHTLEGLGVKPDPVRQVLERTTLYLL